MQAIPRIMAGGVCAFIVVLSFSIDILRLGELTVLNAWAVMEPLREGSLNAGSLIID